MATQIALTPTAQTNDILWKNGENYDVTEFDQLANELDIPLELRTLLKEVYQYRLKNLMSRLELNPLGINYRNIYNDIAIEVLKKIESGNLAVLMLRQYYENYYDSSLEITPILEALDDQLLTAKESSTNIKLNIALSIGRSTDCDMIYFALRIINPVFAAEMLQHIEETLFIK